MAVTAMDTVIVITAIGITTLTTRITTAIMDEIAIGDRATIAGEEVIMTGNAVIGTGKEATTAGTEIIMETVMVMVMVMVMATVVGTATVMVPAIMAMP